MAGKVFLDKNVATVDTVLIADPSQFMTPREST